MDQRRQKTAGFFGQGGGGFKRSSGLLMRTQSDEDGRLESETEWRRIESDGCCSTTIYDDGLEERKLNELEEFPHNLWQKSNSKDSANHYLFLI